MASHASPALAGNGSRQRSADVTTTGRAPLEVGYCADLERRRVITRVTVIPPAPTPWLEEYLASQPTADEMTAQVIEDARRLDERWRQTGPDWVRGLP